MSAAAAAAISFKTLAEHMRAFVADLAEASTLAPPSMEKRMCKLVHDLAETFNPKRKSEGNGTARFTMLSRMMMSGMQVDVRSRKLIWILGTPKPLWR